MSELTTNNPEQQEFQKMQKKCLEYLQREQEELEQASFGVQTQETRIAIEELMQKVPTFDNIEIIKETLKELPKEGTQGRMRRNLAEIAKYEIKDKDDELKKFTPKVWSFDPAVPLEVGNKKTAEVVFIRNFLTEKLKKFSKNKKDPFKNDVIDNIQSIVDALTRYLTIRQIDKENNLRNGYNWFKGDCGEPNIDLHLLKFMRSNLNECKEREKPTDAEVQIFESILELLKMEIPSILNQ